jgi:hypothetical protein
VENSYQQTEWMETYTVELQTMHDQFDQCTSTSDISDNFIMDSEQQTEWRCEDGVDALRYASERTGHPAKASLMAVESGVQADLQNLLLRNVTLQTDSWGAEPTSHAEYKLIESLSSYQQTNLTFADLDVVYSANEKSETTVDDDISMKTTTEQQTVFTEADWNTQRTEISERHHSTERRNLDNKQSLKSKNQQPILNNKPIQVMKYWQNLEDQYKQLVACNRLTSPLKERTSQ